MNDALPSFPFSKPNGGKLNKLEKTINQEDQQTSNDLVQRSQQELLLSLLSMPEPCAIDPRAEEHMTSFTGLQLSFPPLGTQEDTHDDLTANSALEQRSEELAPLSPSQPKIYPLKANIEESDIISSWEMNTPSSPTIVPISMFNMHNESISQPESSTSNALQIKPLTIQPSSPAANGRKRTWFLLAIAFTIILTIFLSTTYVVDKNIPPSDIFQANSIAHNLYPVTLNSISSNKVATAPAVQPTTTSIAPTTLIPIPPMPVQSNLAQKAVATQPLSSVPIVASAPLQNATPTPQPSVSYEAEAPSNTRDGTKTFSCNLCSGGLRVGWISYNIFLQFNNIYVDQTGSYTLNIYYLNSVLNRVTSAFVSINGGPNVTVPGLQVLTVNCCDNIPPQVTQMTINLHAGNNTIQIANPTGYVPDIDRIVIG